MILIELITYRLIRIWKLCILHFFYLGETSIFHLFDHQTCKCRFRDSKFNSRNYHQINKCRFGDS